jgi:hypothetical protein
MRDWQKEAGRFVDKLVHIWMQDPSLKPLVKAVRKQKRIISEEVARILALENESQSDRNGKARSVVIRLALDELQIDLQMEYFIFFKKAKAVGLIMESAFGREGGHADSVMIPYQEEAAKMIARCIFAVRGKDIDVEDIITFLHLFARREDAQLDPDRTMRYKSMLWFAYLSIAIITRDAANACSKGISYFRTKFRSLLRAAMEGRIIDEADILPKPDYEDGKWNDSLFGWMQGDESGPFLEKLWKQFNLDNTSRNTTRVLLPEHRDCMYRQAIAFFC